ncbi:MAG: ribonuclease III [Hyphomicrobiaceae bacterium]|nr:ribonuclease III [Hyphomicrobiaceae bacterium]
MPTSAGRLEQLEDRIGHTFSDRAILVRALSHSSAISPAKRVQNSYQRLEFLGDRVLGLTVADILLKRHPDDNEGELSRKLNAVVRRQACAEVARDLELGRFLVLGESEARTGGADKDAILADVCEALIGAIYCDAGLQKAYDFIATAFAGHLRSARKQGADPKTELQEWAQSRGLPPPNYDVRKRTGPDHAPTFAIAVEIDGFEPALASGSSKKAAEHQAAEDFLVREGIWSAAE